VYFQGKTLLKTSRSDTGWKLFGVRVTQSMQNGLFMHDTARSCRSGHRGLVDVETYAGAFEDSASGRVEEEARCGEHHSQRQYDSLESLLNDIAQYAEPRGRAGVHVVKSWEEVGLTQG
jgi:hypothetical protein